jgi:hypothetical protein
MLQKRVAAREFPWWMEKNGEMSERRKEAEASLCCAAIQPLNMRSNHMASLTLSTLFMLTLS